jgi:hypothetical protein
LPGVYGDSFGLCALIKTHNPNHGVYALSYGIQYILENYSTYVCNRFSDVDFRAVERDHLAKRTVVVGVACIQLLVALECNRATG